MYLNYAFLPSDPVTKREYHIQTMVHSTTALFSLLGHGKKELYRKWDLKLDALDGKYDNAPPSTYRESLKEKSMFESNTDETNFQSTLASLYLVR